MSLLNIAHPIFYCVRVIDFYKCTDCNAHSTVFFTSIPLELQHTHVNHRYWEI